MFIRHHLKWALEPSSAATVRILVNFLVSSCLMSHFLRVLSPFFFQSSSVSSPSSRRPWTTLWRYTTGPRNTPASSALCLERTQVVSYALSQHTPARPHSVIFWIFQHWTTGMRDVTDFGSLFSTNIIQITKCGFNSSIPLGVIFRHERGEKKQVLLP